MSKPRVLVIFYSRTGATRTVAQQIAVSLHADLHELREPRHRALPVGHLRSTRRAVRARQSVVVPAGADPAWYDLVVIGTPVQMGRAAEPVRRYVSAIWGRCRRVAFFATYGSHTDLARVFGELARSCGQEPLASLAVQDCRVQSARLAADIAHFADGIGTHLRVRHLGETEGFRLVASVPAGRHGGWSDAHDQPE